MEGTAPIVCPMMLSDECIVLWILIPIIGLMDVSKSWVYKTVSASFYEQSVSNNTRDTQLLTTLIDHIIHKNTLKLQENYGVEILGE